MAPASALAGSKSSAARPLPPGVPLQVQPVLLYSLDQPRERTSWRAYGGLRSPADVQRERGRIQSELAAARARAGFPLEFLPLATVNSDAEAAATARGPGDAFLVFGASGAQPWLEKLTGSGKPAILFVRHRSGPVYLWYEIAHWRMIRKSEDVPAEPNLDFEDVVVDEYADVTWRLRALYGVKNTRGTRMLAVGGLAAYSRPGQEQGPIQARQIWDMDSQIVSHDELGRRLERVRGDDAALRTAERQAEELVAQRGVRLQTERKFVANSFLALRVFKDLMAEARATNLGVAQCMGSLIPILDTPPCLVLSLLNDEGLTGFCHTDFTHTMPGVLLRWISGQPSFVCNSHFPHHGLMTLAHCSAPRRMNGRDLEPATLMTHYESDYGAATRVHYPKGQQVTCIVPNLRCTQWFGYRGAIVGTPSMSMCRSQMDVQIAGDWRRLTREMEGFHTVVSYGDRLREVGYALRRTGIRWTNYSGA